MRVRSRDTDSWLFARENGWRYPVSREWMMAADSYDLKGRAEYGKKWKKNYPRPWKEADAVRLGKTSLAGSDARAVLAQAKAGDLEWSR